LQPLQVAGRGLPGGDHPGQRRRAVEAVGRRQLGAELQAAVRRGGGPVRRARALLQPPGVPDADDRHHERHDDLLGAQRVPPRRESLTFPVLLAEETRVAGLYNPKRTAPLSILVDRAGHIARVRQGYAAGDETLIAADVAAALAAARPASK